VDSPYGVHTGVRRSWRRYPVARSNELDDLLIAVGAKRDGKAFAVLFDHLQPRVRAQLVRLGLAPGSRGGSDAGRDGDDLAQSAPL
jgi:hypothetical protein